MELEGGPVSPWSLPATVQETIADDWAGPLGVESLGLDIQPGDGLPCWSLATLHPPRDMGQNRVTALSSLELGQRRPKMTASSSHRMTQSHLGWPVFHSSLNMLMFPSLPSVSR